MRIQIIRIWMTGVLISIVPMPAPNGYARGLH
jgi:hypothetical protein